MARKPKLILPIEDTFDNVAKSIAMDKKKRISKKKKFNFSKLMA